MVFRLWGGEVCDFIGGFGRVIVCFVIGVRVFLGLNYFGYIVGGC